MDPVGMESLLAKLNAAREALSQGVGATAGDCVTASGWRAA